MSSMTMSSMTSNPTSFFKWTEDVLTAKIIRKIEAAAAAVGYPEFLMDGLLLVDGRNLPYPYRLTLTVLTLVIK